MALWSAGLSLYFVFLALAWSVHHGAKEPCSGSAYLGGTWEKYGENPSVSNPEISGYEPQMTVEALNDLRIYCDPKTIRQIDKAIRLIKKEMQASYKAQMQPA